MAYERSIRRFRSGYAALLRLYPKRYRDRFAEPMEQTCHDLLRERADEQKGLFGITLWLFIETFAGIVRENRTVIVTQHRNIIRIALVTACILMVPLVAMQLTEEVNWGLFDFVVMGALLFGAGLANELVAKKVPAIAYRAAVGVALAAAFLLVWVNGAVGIIGDGEEDVASVMYVGGVLAVGFVGAFIARFQPYGMARALFATALAQALVAMIALLAGRGSTAPIWPWDILMVTGFFVSLWVVSALLFRRACVSSPMQN